MFKGEEVQLSETRLVSNLSGPSFCPKRLIFFRQQDPQTNIIPVVP